MQKIKTFLKKGGLAHRVIDPAGVTRKFDKDKSIWERAFDPGGLGKETKHVLSKDDKHKDKNKRKLDFQA